MRGTNRFLGAVLAVGLVLALAACAKGNLDAGDSANVVLAIQNVAAIPPVTASPSTGGSGCTFTVTSATATLANKSKTVLAASPYGDIVVENVVMDYTWVSPTGSEVTHDVQAVAGLVPVAGSQSVSFTPIRLDYVSTAEAGRTADLTLVFHGHTVDGIAVQTEPISGVQLSINSCASGSVCGNGTITGTETCDDGGLISGDGCSSSCQIEQGWRCQGQPSVCTPDTTP